MKKLLLFIFKRAFKITLVIIFLEQIKTENLLLYSFLLLATTGIIIIELIYKFWLLFKKLIKNIYRRQKTEVLPQQTWVSYLEPAQKPSRENENIIPVYDFPVHEDDDYSDVDFYIPDCIEENDLKTKQQKFKQETKIAAAQSNIDFYLPLLEEQKQILKSLENRRSVCNQKREYDKVDRISQQIIRAKTNIFKTEQKLEKAYSVIEFPV